MFEVIKHYVSIVDAYFPSNHLGRVIQIICSKDILFSKLQDDHIHFLLKPILSNRKPELPHYYYIFESRLMSHLINHLDLVEMLNAHLFNIEAEAETESYSLPDYLVNILCNAHLDNYFEMLSKDHLSKLLNLLERICNHLNSIQNCNLELLKKIRFIHFLPENHIFNIVSKIKNSAIQDILCDLIVEKDHYSSV